jgi:hypothetical protein
MFPLLFMFTTLPSPMRWRAWTLERRLQLTVNSLSHWALQNGFPFSAAKTQRVQFLRLRGVHPPPVLYLNNHDLPVVPSAKYLGLVLGIRFSWEPHLRQLRASCERSLNVLRVLSRASWGGDRTVMFRLSCSLVCSKRDYGSFIYGSATQAKLRILDPVYHAVIRLATGAFCTSPDIICMRNLVNLPFLYGGNFFFVITPRNLRPISITRPTVRSSALLLVTSTNGTSLPRTRCVALPATPL